MSAEEGDIPQLLVFFKPSCPHTKRAVAHINTLKKEKNVEVGMIDVNGSQQAYELYSELALDRCKGVPYFVNLENGKALCGAPSDYAVVKDWSE